MTAKERFTRDEPILLDDGPMRDYLARVTAARFIDHAPSPMGAPTKCHVLEGTIGASLARRCRWRFGQNWLVSPGPNHPRRAHCRQMDLYCSDILQRECLEDGRAHSPVLLHGELPIPAESMPIYRRLRRQRLESKRGHLNKSLLKLALLADNCRLTEPGNRPSVGFREIGVAPNMIWCRWYGADEIRIDGQHRKETS